MITAADRVSAVLARDERLVEAFVAASPAFARLRSPAMRRVMARLVTVEQAARIAGVDPEALVAMLNQALGAAAPGAVPEPQRGDSVETTMEMPPALAAVPAERVVDLDVRDHLRRGEEPFSHIMAARRELPPGGALRLRAIFEPVPLYAVMEKQGLAHWTERLAADDWRVWFYPAPVAEPLPSTETAPTAGPAAPGAEEDVVVLDVRGLEPPEPMLRTLEALEALPAGKTLVQLNERVPRFLLPEVERRGFLWEVREQEPGLVRTFFRRANP